MPVTIAVVTEPIAGGVPILESLALAAETVAGAWRAAARRYADKGTYASSIEVEGIFEEGDSCIARIVNKAPYSRVLESGRQEFNLAEKVAWGAGTPHMKVNAEGEPYITIPLRHYAPVDPEQWETQGISRTEIRQMMPEEVYKLAKQLGRTQMHGGSPTQVFYKLPKDGRTPTKNGKQTAFAEPRDYQWGDRLKHPLVDGTRFKSMYKIGAPRHTSYMTFRTLTPNSQWMIPAFPGYQIAETAAKEVVPQVAAVLARSAAVQLINVVAEAMRG